ncbi:hypothetical protein, partial [Carboxylicivirga sp. M1479]|uniref:hypothetical protein n=1 Tax=Carboxylicivirga sp. M1479 TaxID=2594476 RepID=UPI001C8F3CC8
LEFRFKKKIQKIHFLFAELKIRLTFAAALQTRGVNVIDFRLLKQLKLHFRKIGKSSLKILDST